MSDDRGNDLTTNVVTFCAGLRSTYRFGIGPRETRDALRAIDAVGIADRDRVRSALRLVCCSTHAQTLVFDRAFDAFFSDTPPGLPQSAYAPRHTRPGRDRAQPRGGVRASGARGATDELPGDGRGPTLERRPDEVRENDAAGWQTLRARYSPASGRAVPLELDRAAQAKMRGAAELLVKSVRLGYSRRYAATHGRGRFDLRRTFRASLATGGDPVHLRFLGHPHRNPRFVILIDGSRSMSDYTSAVVAFASALCERTPRTNVFFFSTALREVTKDLRAVVRRGAPFPDFGEAWGGGTKIGANLARFESAYGALLTPETIVFVYSDGLDVGSVVELERAMREIDRRTAGIVWLNPHAAAPDYLPSARGMRAALPFVTLLAAANDAPGFERLAVRIAQSSRIRGKR